jgi:hypothetical protein
MRSLTWAFFSLFLGFLFLRGMTRMLFHDLDGTCDGLDHLDLILKIRLLHAREQFSLLRGRIKRRQVIQRENRNIPPALIAAAAIRILGKDLIELIQHDILHIIFGSMQNLVGFWIPHIRRTA